MKRNTAQEFLKSLAILSIGLAFVSSAAQAEEEHEHEGHGDALVYESGGQVQMGFIDVECFGGGGEPGCEDHGELGNVYEAELEVEGTSPGQHGHSESPGFFSIPTGGSAALPAGGSLLPANASHNIDFILAPSSLATGQSILYWNGSGGSVNWGSVANGESFEIDGNAGSGGVLASTSVLSGVTLDSTGANSLFDTHPEYHLEGTTGADPSAGFYAIFGVTTIGGLTPSDPWAIVFAYDLEDEAAHEMAVDSIASVVPEPGTAILMGLGLIGLAARGKRDRV